MIFQGARIVSPDERLIWGFFAKKGFSCWLLYDSGLGQKQL